MAKENLKLIVFTMEADQEVYEYGIPIGQVHEITRLGKIIKLPGVPSFVEGVMNLRGSVISILDIKKRFSLGTTTTKDTTRIIVVQLNGRKCGIVVDDVLEILPLAAENMEDASTALGGISSRYIIGIGKVDDRLVIALDVNKILTGEEEQELASVV